MKGGLAAYLVAAAIARETAPGSRGDLFVSSVIEEECGGNGMWTVSREIAADGTLIGESTGGALAYAGVGVLWLTLSASAGAGHAARARQSGAFESLSRAVAALRAFERELNERAVESDFTAISAWPYGMTVGRLVGGVWTSSVPIRLEAHVRLAFGPEWTPAEAETAARHAVKEAAPGVEVAPTGFRARAYRHDPDGPLGRAVAAVHAAIGEPPPRREVLLATTDARFVQGDCLCYGPTAGNLHAADEWVDVESLHGTAEVVARVAVAWLVSPSVAR